MKINPVLYGTLVVMTFFGIIFGFQTTGLWSTSGKVSGSGEAIQPLADDVNSIKGWMTLEQISTIYNVPVSELLSNFNLPADTLPSTAIKDLENDTFEVTALREWLLSRNAPTETVQSTNIPITNPRNPTDIPQLQITATQTVTDHVVTPGTITGKTTFQELFDWGVPVDVVQKIIGGNLPDPSEVIKDYITTQGLEFSTIKTQLQIEVDSIK